MGLEMPPMLVWHLLSSPRERRPSGMKLRTAVIRHHDQRQWWTVQGPHWGDPSERDAGRSRSAGVIGESSEQVAHRSRRCGRIRRLLLL